MVGLALLLVLLSVLLTTPIIQSEIARFATEKINKQFNIDTHIHQVAITIDGSVVLKHVLIFDDHNNTLAKIDRMHTNILDFNKLTEGQLYFGSTALENLDFHIRTYKHDSLSNLDKFIAVFDDGQPGSGKFFMSIKNIEVFNGNFSVHNENNPNPVAVDFKELNGAVENLIVRGPNISGDIKALSMQTHWGVYVEKLTTNYAMTKTAMNFDNLNLKTLHSDITGDIAMKYAEGGLKDFTTAVDMTVNFKKSKLSTTDLKQFYKEFTPNTSIFLNGLAKGTLNTFKLYNARLQTSNDMDFVGQLGIENLFDKTKEFKIFADIDRLQVSRNQAVSILPNVLGNALPPIIDNLGAVNASGKFEYGNFAVNADLDVLTAIGNANAVFKMQQINQKESAKYTGDIFLENFQLGQMLGNNSLGNISAELFVNGSGFTAESLQTIVSGTISDAYFNGYNYSNISLDGEFKVPYYQGYIISKDPSATLDFDGVIDLSEQNPSFNFVADVHHLDMNKLNFIKDSLGIFKGKFELLGVGKSVDEFEGVLNVHQAVYTNAKDIHSFQNFQLTADNKDDGSRIISVNSPEIVNGYIQGDFKFKQIRAIVENALGSLYTNYKPNPLEGGQYVNFDLNISNKIIELLLPTLTVSDETNIKGNIVADSGDFKLQFHSPYVHISNNKLRNINLSVDNQNPLFNTYMSIDTVRLSGYNITDFNLINITENDTLFVRTEFKGGAESKDFFNLNLFHTIEEENRSIIGVQKSEVNFKDYLWYLNENDGDNNRIIFNKKLDDFEVEPIILSHNGQEVSLEGKLKGKNYKDLKLEFKEVDLAKITPDLGAVSFAGLINGIVSFEQVDQIFRPASNLKIDSFEFNDVLLGEFNFDVVGDEKLENFSVNANIINDFTESLYLRGGIAVKKGESILNLDAGFTDFDLRTITPFLSSIFNDIRGKASGRATILGTHKNPKIAGRLHLNNAGMKPVFTNVDYAFEENAILDITESQFILNNVRITDIKYLTEGTINGVITHNKLKNWRLDTQLSSSNLLALDIDYIEGTPYYGQAFIDGSAKITGPVEALNVSIEATSMPGTRIKIPLDDAGGLGDNNYVHFLSAEEKRDREKGIITSNPINQFGGVQLNFDFYITPDAEIEVLLDRVTGHGMKGKGAGFITMEINTLGRFNMWGDFMVYEGEYNFKYEGIIDKKLDVNKYGTIRWDGEPLNAILNLEAIYRTQANPGLLLESSEINRKVDTEVIIALSGSLASPEIDFLIDFPNVTSVIKSEIEYKLADKDTRETQAMALLATGSFLTAQNAPTAVYGSLFERASSLFDDLFSDEDGKFRIGLNYSQRDHTPLAEQDAARVGVTLSTQITDRVLINGKLGVPVGGAEENVIVGDVEVQLLLNEEGNLRARVFSRENDINYLGEGIGYTQGTGLTYEVEFDTFKELLQKIFLNAEKRARKKELEKQLTPNEATTPVSDDDYGVEFLKFQERRDEENSTNDTLKEE